MRLTTGVLLASICFRYEKSEMEKWCEKHKPNGDICRVHNLRLKEMHLDGHDVLAGLMAIFYCPVLSCMELEPIWGYTNNTDGLQLLLTRADFSLKFGLSISEGNNLLAETVIYNALRIQVLAHKLGQREGDGK